MVEPTARFTDIKIPLFEPVHGLDHVRAVMGTPRWWPTGARVSVVLAHDSSNDMDDSLIEFVQRELTERKYLTLRFNFPFAEAGRKRADPMAVLRRVMRSAVGMLAQDPTSAPAHLFLGGLGLGGQVAADLAATRVRVDGLCFLGYPLHPQGKPEKAQPEGLYRMVAPLLFIQGERDRRCDLDVLRKVLLRVGAPTHLVVCDEADHHFNVRKKGDRSLEEVRAEILAAIDGWIERVLDV